MKAKQGPVTAGELFIVSTVWAFGLEHWMTGIVFLVLVLVYESMTE